MNFDHEKTVKIPVKVAGNKVQYFYGGATPELEDGTIGDLTVPQDAVLDKRKLKILDRKDSYKFFEKGRKLLCEVDPKGEIQPEKNLMHYVKKLTNPPGRFVELILEDDLYILLRGAKLGNLKPCSCSVTALPDEPDLGSVNQGYTAITRVFEPHRKSGGGNVFLMVFAESDNGQWLPLKDFRDKVQAQYAKEFELLNQWWSFKKDLFSSDWALVIWKDERHCTVRCIRNQVTIYADFYFPGTDKAIEWLNDKGYTEYHPREQTDQHPPGISFI